MNEPTQDRIPFSLRLYPKITSPDGILLTYLKKQLPPVKNEMVLKALRGYWLAEAYQSSGKKRGQELKRLAQQMVFTLEEQANYLRVVFDLAPQYSAQPSTLNNLGCLQTSTQTSTGVASFNIENGKPAKAEEEENTWESIPILDMDVF
jgi:hypothetical protein